MDTERSRLIKNAIKENTRYLTGNDTYKVYKFMVEQGLIEESKTYYKEADTDGKAKIDYKNTIIANFNNNTEVMLNYFEEHEYNKSYKYGVVKQIESNYEGLSKKFDDLIKNSIVSLLPNNYDNNFKNPRFIKERESFSLKFSYVIGMRPDKADWFAFPVIVNIYPMKNVMIISFDSFPYSYHTKKEFYQYIAKSVRDWIESNLAVKTKEIKLLDMVKDIINIKSKQRQYFKEIKEYVRDGYDKRGGRFKMTADDDDEMSFLDQLEKIAESLSTEEDKNKLHKFIYDISNNMKFVERGLTWIKYNNKGTKMTMTFRENFVPNEMLLIHFYDNNWDRGRVIYGIDYIINYKTQIKKRTKDTEQVG